jgi:hypothetical protein
VTASTDVSGWFICPTCQQKWSARFRGEDAPRAPDKPASTCELVTPCRGSVLRAVRGPFRNEMVPRGTRERRTALAWTPAHNRPEL